MTDALITRHIGRAWAGANDAKQQFIDALTVVPVGSKVGEWSVQLLATPGYELVARLALLRDSDRRDGSAAAEPSWMNRYDSETVQCFINHPTLEPALTSGNENLVETTLAIVGIDSSGDLTPQLVDDLFHAGPGRRRKGEFAFALAAEMESAIDRSEPPTVPEHFEDMFEFLYAQPSQVDEVLDDAAAAAD